VLRTPEKIRQLQRKLYRKARQDCESHRKKMIEKFRLSGRKPNLRFDEGEPEIERSLQPPRQISTIERVSLAVFVNFSLY
jgi:hypothetical protein